MSIDPDVPDQVRKLAELRDSGALSPQEFETLKARVIAAPENSLLLPPSAGEPRRWITCSS